MSDDKFSVPEPCAASGTKYGGPDEAERCHDLKAMRGRKIAQRLAIWPAAGFSDTQLIPSLTDQNRCAQSRNPMDMIRHG